ncbi:hypothetical protein PJKIFABJ_00119 [Pseudomonas phage PE09]|uniref:DNA/pantothenate metabolism flavoprotein C-terminal domain-containing protein n=1 Tax=Pseudomonas phage PE09 TaxID=2696355 RepID=A0A9E6KQW4_9CAUD|nr:hypothetical protein QGX22_gp135 [Pseudomonas phage PE09]QHZ60055.1 hypothetical protein PJKIFABJ_00119 [Pseudomonas phage PE09]
MSRVVILGGGTFNHVACHLALAAPAFGGTAKQLDKMFRDNGTLEPYLALTKMADPASHMITNEHVAHFIELALEDEHVKAIVMNAAICDFEMDNPSDQSRLSSSQDYQVTLRGINTKIMASIKQKRPDIVVVGFKTTHGASKVEQVAKAFTSMHNSGLDMVLANDVDTRNNILVTKDLTIQTGSREFLLDQIMCTTVIYHNMKQWNLEE